MGGGAHMGASVAYTPRLWWRRDIQWMCQRIDCPNFHKVHVPCVCVSQVAPPLGPATPLKWTGYNHRPVVKSRSVHLTQLLIASRAAEFSVSNSRRVRQPRIKLFAEGDTGHKQRGSRQWEGATGSFFNLLDWNMYHWIVPKRRYSKSSRTNRVQRTV